jgi:hypothetical protein
MAICLFAWCIAMAALIVCFEVFAWQRVYTLQYQYGTHESFWSGGNTGAT